MVAPETIRRVLCNHGPVVPEVHFEVAMNIYIEPAASATKTATDSTAPQAKSWRDVLPIHPAAELLPTSLQGTIDTDEHEVPDRKRPR